MTGQAVDGRRTPNNNTITNLDDVIQSDVNN